MMKLRFSRIARAARSSSKAIVGVVLTAVFVLAGAPVAQADSYTPITGVGSTWSQNALDQWRSNVKANYGMTVNYSGLGSSAGRSEFLKRTVDYAVSEIPFQTVAGPDNPSPEIIPSDLKYAYMPIVAGGTAFMYSLKIGGQRVTNLRLSGDVISKIFNGDIKNWSDPAIKADNPGLTMPDKTIVPVVRSDGSGSTAQFTLWMSKQHSDVWTTGMTSQFPTKDGFKYQSGSAGVSGYVAQNYGEGAITYVEYSYAMKQGFPVAKVLNDSNYYVEPTANSVAVALLGAKINEDLTQDLTGVYTSKDPRAYPLSSYSYMILYTDITGTQFTTDKGKTLSTFAKYMLCDGQNQAADLGYSPLPRNLVAAAFQQVKRIPGTVFPSGDIPADCTNPTFDAADPQNNRLADTAAQPQACDAKGATQCAGGTGGAAGEDTPTSGSGSGSGSAGGTSAGGSAGTSGGMNAAGSTTTDEFGNVVSTGAGGSASGSGGAAGNVSASPFKVEDAAWGAPQNLMIGATVLILAAALLPPFLAPVLSPRVSRMLGRNKPPTE
jgi:phosphate transport system substrate-binding protein